VLAAAPVAPAAAAPSAPARRDAACSPTPPDTIAEVQDGAVVVAQCSQPCQQVRVRGKDLDQTLALNPNSVVYEALTDAINGQLQVYTSRSR